MENCSLKDVTYDMSQPGEMVHYAFNETFLIVELDNTTRAKSLDGSNYKFLIHPGEGEGKDKFIIHFPGSLLCGSDGLPILESCFLKLGRFDGTSSVYGANGTWETKTTPMGFFSSMKEYNPKFWNYNKVELLPLDGISFQGSLDDPLEYNGSQIWFRGYDNTKEAINYLKIHYGLYNSSEIIFNGGSANGIAAMIWRNYLKDEIPEQIKVSLVNDASLFLDMYNKNAHCYLFRFMKQQIVETLSLNKTDLYKNCKFRSTELWKCLMVEYIYEDIEYPVFFSNALTDTRELSNFMGLNCILRGGPDECNSSERETMNEVREYMLNLTLTMKQHKNNFGFWLRACFEHGLALSWAWYGHSFDVFNADTQSTSSLRDALYSWYFGEDKNSSYIDLIDWLHNPRCNYKYA